MERDTTNGGFGGLLWRVINVISSAHFLATTGALAVAGIAGGYIRLVARFPEPWKTITTIGTIGVVLSLAALVLRVGRSWYYRRKMRHASTEAPAHVPPGAIFSFVDSEDSSVKRNAAIGVARDTAPQFLHVEGGTRTVATDNLVTGPREPRFSVGEAFNPRALAAECSDLSQQLMRFLGTREAGEVRARHIDVPAPIGRDLGEMTEYRRAWNQSLLDSQAFSTETMTLYTQEFEARCCDLYERLEENGFGNRHLASLVRYANNSLCIAEIAQEYGVIGQRLLRINQPGDSGAATGT
jgi:hypothetical protein